jgi:WD40 repeat protein
MHCALCGHDRVPHDAKSCPFCEQVLPIPPTLDFSTYIAKHTRDFTGREWVFRAINNWLADPEGSRIFLLTGEPGCGKTAIAGRLVQFSQGTAPPREGLAHLVPGFLSAFHFSSARDHRWINPHTFTESLALQLSRYPEYASVLATLSVTAHGQQQQPIQVVHQDIEQIDDQGQAIGILNSIEHLDVRGTPPEDAFVRAVIEPLVALCRERPGQQIVLLVDALDEALIYSGEVGIVALLARCGVLPGNVRFLVTTHPRIEVLRPLQRNKPQECWLTTGVGLAHSLEDVKAYVVHVLDQRPELNGNLSADLSATAFADAVRDKSQGNFLYVSYLLEMLVAQGSEISHKSLDDLPTGLPAFYLEFLERLLRDDGTIWEERYAPILGTLAVAREALTEKQLAAFVKADQPRVRRGLQVLRPFLDVDESLPASKRTYTLYHRSFVDFLLNGDQAEGYWCEAARQHERIIAHHQGQASTWMEVNWSRVDDYGLLHLPAHLSEVGRADALREVLLDFDWLQAKLETTDVTALVADYDLLPADADARRVGQALRLSAHVLTRDKAQLWSQLYGRLMGEQSAAIQEMLEDWPEELWLRPLRPSLTAPAGPLLHTLMGPSDTVCAVAVYDGGRRAISGSWDETLRIWDLERGQELHTLEGHSGQITALAVYDGGRRAISASKDNTLRVWDLSKKGLERGQELCSLTGHSGPVTAVAVYDGGRRAISASDDHTVRVWDLERAQQLRTLEGHSRWVQDVAVYDGGRRAISASGDHTLKVWDLERGQELCSLTGHSGPICAVAVYDSGRRAISGSWDETLKIWDLERGQELHTLEGRSGRITALAVYDRGQRAISASLDGTLKVWDLSKTGLEPGQELRTLEGYGFAVLGLAVCHGGRRAISASSDGLLRVWDLSKTDLVHGQGLGTLEGHGEAVTALAVYGGGRRAVSASYDHTLMVWDLERGRALRTLAGHRDSVHAVAVYDGGRRAISASYDGTLKIWDLSEKGPERPQDPRTLKVWAWNLERDRGLRISGGHTGPVESVAVFDGGRRAISASRDHTLKVWDLERGQALCSLEGHSDAVTAVAVDEGRRRAISASYDHTLKIWDLSKTGLESGREAHTLTGHTGPVTAVAVYDAGRRAISASRDNTLRVWDLSKKGLETGKEPRTLEGHSGPVTAVTVDGGGRRATSASLNGTLKIWDLGAGVCLHTFTGESGLLTCAVAPDGRTVVAGDAGGQVHILRLEGGA